VISFENAALVDYMQWVKEDRKVYDKINTLLTEIMRDPFHGTGKPELMRGDRAGYWSRRITQEHRLVYKVFADRTVITSCKNHY